MKTDLLTTIRQQFRRRIVNRGSKEIDRFRVPCCGHATTFNQFGPSHRFVLFALFLPCCMTENGRRARRVCSWLVSGWRHFGEKGSDSPNGSRLKLGPLLTGVGCGVRKPTSICRVLGNRCFSFGNTRSPFLRYFSSIRSPHRSGYPERGRRHPPVALFDKRNSQAVPSARRTQEPLPGSARPSARSAPLFRAGRGGQRPSCGALRGSSSRGR